mmetsp:Transcript_3299/g.9479  ORF Transcript_3299/g.9479 Transcript_3299/m.9479 type:complete len:173 (-) Transcript_3299:93-611(-)|eukprot:CAMPEP_0117654108 /NCGR_PEP_ID=MMETSP0804-20121206/3563_1 /TAXON_ID=1074897 /ORGANISM="Tetraselmis astigmatica, Strain CCMP880" /LENGTH=172 /DNA_ID=CAMNT_0005460357 /DNA_START=263 /DNA_END=781 /DNA_ORIENTATION=-
MARQESTAMLRQWFDSVDVDRSGSISVMELQRALALGNLNFSLATVAHMIRLHDQKQTGSINFQDFQSLHTFLTNMRASFQYFDSDRSGQLDLNEVHNAVTRAGFQLDEHAFYATCKAFDPDRSGTLGEPEFIALTIFLQSAKGIFEAFDTGRTGSVTFSFPQFVYAAANTR